MRGGSVSSSSERFDAPLHTAVVGGGGKPDGWEAHLLGRPRGSRRDEIAVDALTADENLERHRSLYTRKDGMDISTREEWRRGIKNQAGREKLNGLDLAMAAG